MLDYYSLLGVKSKATKSEIKKNYYILANKYHPDKSQEPESAKKFIAITEAYEVLSNNKTRTIYDLKRWQLMKKAEESEYSINVVTEPEESIRTRRNRSQQKRSVEYHGVTQKHQKTKLLFLESMHISSRYILHIIGILLMSFLIFITAKELLPIDMNKGILIILGLSGFVSLLAYGIFKTLENIFVEIRKDIQRFSIYYKISHQRSSRLTITVFICSIALLSFLLMARQLF